MVKSFKYILKRILIGVGIALVLAYLKGGLVLQAHALQATSSINIGSKTDVVDNTTNAVFYYTNGNYWQNQDDGVLYFDFSIFKVSGGATDPNVAPAWVRAHSGNNGEYVCYIGSSTMSNSTFNGGTYSAVCPMHMSSSGLTSVVIKLQDNQQNGLSQYRVVFNGLFTWQRDTDYTLLDSINNKLNGMGDNSGVINNQNSNTQSIINNQNSNTDKEIESQKVCSYIDKNKNSTKRRYLDSNGTLQTAQTWGVTDYLNIIGSNIIVKATQDSSNAYLCFYNTNKSLISCIVNNSLTLNQNISIPQNSSYVRFSINNSTDKPQFEICSNGNQSIVNSQQDINNTLNDTSGGEVSSSWFDDFETSSSTPISDLLTLPISLIQAYVNGFSSTCQSMNLGSLYGTYIIIPCVSISSYIGSDLWSLIDTLFCLFMAYNIGLLCISIFEGITSLQDDMQFLYSPRHAGGGDTRVERYGDDY